MSKEDILSGLKKAMVDLDEPSLHNLLDDGLKINLSPLEMITEGLSPSLITIGEGFESGEMFMADMVVAGEMMNDAMNQLLPVIAEGGQSTGDTMVIGTVEGDDHNIGKRIVASLFIGAGYHVIDIGENQSADAFVSAAKEHKATVVGASAILGPLKPYCKVISDAMVDAGIRDDVIYIVGGWGMSQEWCDKVHADAWAYNAVEAISKVKLIRSGKTPRFNNK